MKNNFLCVISSLDSSGQPQSAVVGYSEDGDGNLVIGTSKFSRKYQNIVSDPRVSVVIGWDDRQTIQYEGTARELVGDERQKYQALHIAKHPRNERFKDDPNEAYILVTPTWVRLTNADVDPWDIEMVEEWTQ